MAHIWVGLAAILTSGCVGIDREHSSAIEALPRAPYDLTNWNVKGKASFSYQGETETARFQWYRHSPQNDVIILAGPFSLNSQTIERQGDTLLWRDGEHLLPLSKLDKDSPAVTALTSIPPKSLGQWLLGAAPSSLIWEVDVADWQAAPPWSAPSRVTIRGVGMEIKVIISQWEFSLAP